MDVKEAVRKAADYVADLESMTENGETKSSDQALHDMRFAIEGTRFDENNGQWIIDVGFTRPWDIATTSPLAGLPITTQQDKRTYKTVTIDDASGKVLVYGSN